MSTPMKSLERTKLAITHPVFLLVIKIFESFEFHAVIQDKGICAAEVPADVEADI